MAETNSELLDQIPPLRPPRGEIPQTFWEQKGGWIILLGALALFVCILVIWLLRRPKPAVPVPPEVEAVKALEALRGKPEDGRLLVQASRIVRHYFAAAFTLPPNENTTTEFAQLLKGNEKIGDELAGRVSEFLRQCDERKFAPANQSPPLGAIPNASNLIELGEERRARLRQADSSLPVTHPAGKTSV